MEESLSSPDNIEEKPAFYYSPNIKSLKKKNKQGEIHDECLIK